MACARIYQVKQRLGSSPACTQAQRVARLATGQKRHGSTLAPKRASTAASSSSQSADGAAAPALPELEGPARVFAASLDVILGRYFATAPGAARVVEALYRAPGGFGAAQVKHDHLAFRTFNAPGLGIDGLGAALEGFGFKRREGSAFEKKKLTSAWYAPPPARPGGPPDYERLPRVFVSQLETQRLSPRAQGIIARHTAGLERFGAAGAWAAAVTGALPWAPPNAEDYAALLEESEYAAWVLANGYALNHTALSVHRIEPPVGGGLGAFNARLSAAGFTLADEGGVVKASADGLLLQSSTVADVRTVVGRDGREFRAVGAYMEFVERRPLPEFASLPEAQLSEAQRRDGFEAASADNIFASTTLAARAVGGM